MRVYLNRAALAGGASIMRTRMGALLAEGNKFEISLRYYAGM